MIGQFWKSRQSKNRQAAARRKGLFQPRMEILESRLALATAVWDGGGATNQWTTAANWVGDVAPTAGDDLLFPGAANQTSNVNSFAPNTSFGSITLASSGYSITGSAVRLTGGLISINPSGSNSIALPLNLTGPRSITSTHAGTTLSLSGAISVTGTLTVNGTGNTDLSGVISGTGALVKSGPGQLSVSNDNTYSGLTTVSAGVLSVSGFGAPLGSIAAGTVVVSGATLQTTQIVDIAEPLTLNGYGVHGDVLNSPRGALEVGPPSFTTWTGPITLASDASIGVNHTGDLTVTTNPVRLNGHQLTVNNAGPARFNSPIVNGVGGNGSLAINTSLVRGTEYGTVSLTANNTYTGSTLINSGVLLLSGNGELASTDIQLTGAPGLGTSNGFPIPGGVLKVDNSAGLNGDRLPDNATLTFNGGAFHYVGFNDFADSSETIGSIHIAGGHSYIRSEAGGSAGASNTLTVDSIERDTGATVDFSGVGLGTSKNRLLVMQAPSTVGSNGGILPYATYTAATQDFATYNAALGVSRFIGYAIDLATAGPNDVVLITDSQTLSTSKTIAGLLISGSPSLTSLTVDRGVVLNIGNTLLTSGADASIISGTGTGAVPRITFGASEGIILRDASTTLGTAISGSMSLTLSGTDPLILEPPVSGNTYTGGTTLNSGQLTINENNTPLGAADAPLTLRGGALGVSIFVGAISLPHPLILENANANFTAISTILFTGPTTLTGRNIVAVPGNVIVDLVGQVSGTGSLIVTAATNTGSGGGTLALSNVTNNYTGGTTLVNSGIFAPTLQLGGNSVLGSGQLLLASGNVTATTPVAIGNAVKLTESNVTFGGSQTINFAGPVAVAGISTLSRNFFAGPTVTISGVISGPGAITKGGDHVLAFTANNTYSGSTLVTGGELVVNGAQTNSPVGVTGGTLAGTGTVGFISAGSGGSVSPGSPSPAFGRLSAQGANFSAGGTLRLQVGADFFGTDFDQLNLGNGRLILGNNSPLELNLEGLINPRRVFNLVRYGSRLGSTTQFSPVNVTNNSEGHTAELEYTATSLNVLIASQLNSPPNITTPGAQNTIEDTSIVFSNGNANRIFVGDPDAGNAPIEVSLTASNGTLTLSGIAGLTFVVGDGTDDANVVFTGNIAAINAALNGLTFELTPNYAGPAGIQVNVDDLGYFGLGGPQTASSAVNINASPVNDAGSVVINGIAREDQVLTAVVTDADGTGTISYQWQRNSGTGFVNIAGAVNNTFTPVDVHVGSRLRVVVNYTDNQGFVQSLTSSQTAVVVGVNDRPIVGSIGSNLTYRENAQPIVVAGTATATDVDSGNFATGKLRVQVGTGGHANDRLAIRTFGNISTNGTNVLYAGQVIGTFAGGIGRTALVVTFNAAATPFKAQSVLRSVTFRNVSETPTTANRNLLVTLTDGDGGTSNVATKLISVVAVNDAPVISPPDGGSVGYQNGTAAIGLLTTATLADPDSANYAGGKLVVRFTSGGHVSNRLHITGGFTQVGNEIQLTGQTIGTLNTNGGVGTTRLEVTFNANATRAIVQNLLRSIKFRTISAASTAQRVIEFSLTDGDGGVSNKVSKTVNVT